MKYTLRPAIGTTALQGLQLLFLGLALSACSATSDNAYDVATSSTSQPVSDCPDYGGCSGYCGDYVCTAGEDVWNCPSDCSGGGYCGDGLCDASETDWCSTDCGYTSYCGDGYCSGAESCSACEQDCGACPINVPGTPQLKPISDLYARAQALGVSPLVAGVPNIDTYLAGGQSASNTGDYTTSLYPTGATSVQDFINKLFQNGIWQNNGPNQTATQSQPDALGCYSRQVDERYNPEDLVSFDAGAGLLYPSALNQGAYVNLGVGSLTPIHVPYPQRKPVKLVATFYKSATAPTATSTDVYNAIGQLINAANASGGITQSSVYFDMQSASTLEEAAVKFKLDAKLLGGNVSATFNSGTSTQSNTVFVRFTQSLFTVFQDLGGFTPALAQFNTSNFLVQDLNRLGDAGELGYDNLPTYVRSVTYGRMLLFSVTSSTSKSELEAAVNAVYGPFGASATATQKSIVQNSQLRLFAYGGVSEPALAAIKSGSWQDYFTLTNVPLSSLKPLGYEIRRLDDQLATMSRTTRYIERICPKIYNMRLDIKDAYKEARVYHRPGNSSTWTQILGVRGDSSLNLNNYLVGADDRIQIGFIVGKSDMWTPWRGRIQFSAFADDVLKIGPLSFSCSSCGSRDVKAYKVNKYTGEFTEVPLESW